MSTLSTLLPGGRDAAATLRAAYARAKSKADEKDATKHPCGAKDKGLIAPRPRRRWTQELDGDHEARAASTAAAWLEMRRAQDADARRPMRRAEGAASPIYENVEVALDA